MSARKDIGVPKRFFRSMMTGVFGRVVVIVLLVEGIFLGEKFPELFSNVFDRHGGIADVLLLLGCATPEIFALALALALLLAVYQTLLRSRENREILVISGAGAGTFEFVAFLLVIGLVGLFGSMLISGLVQPAAQYAKRVVLFDAEYNALLHGGGDGQFYAFPGHTLYVGAQSGQPPNARVFIEQRNADHTYAITSDAARLSQARADGQLVLSLTGVRVVAFDGTPAKEEAAVSAGHPAASGADPLLIEGSSAIQRLSLSELIPFQARGGTTDEMTIFALIERAVGSVAGGQKEVRAFGNLLAQSLLSLFAPLLAAAALCLTNRKTQVFAIPAALLLLVVANLLMVATVRFLANFGAAALVTALVVTAVVIIAGLATLIRRMQNNMILPMQGRP
jgi:lipopolysaccharide export LptBFGC system permease protein LptF